MYYAGAAARESSSGWVIADPDTLKCASPAARQSRHRHFGHAPGPRLAWAVEGTRSHGPGLPRALRQVGILSWRRDGRPGRQAAGRQADPADALRAARDVLSADQLAQPRSDRTREGLGMLLAARAQPTTARTAAVNTHRALLLGPRPVAGRLPSPAPPGPELRTQAAGDGQQDPAWLVSSVQLAMLAGSAILEIYC
jgi:hypothetical protein